MSIAGDYTAIVNVAVSDAKLKQQIEKISKQVERRPIKINVQMSKGLKEFEKYVKRATQAVEKLQKAMGVYHQDTKLADAQTKKLNDSVRKLNASTKNLNTSTNKLKVSTNNYQSSVKTAHNNIEKLAQAQKQARNSSKELGETFAGTIARIAKFDAGYAVIRAFKQGISEAIEVVFDFDASLTEFKKVSDLSGSSLDTYTEKLGQMGEEVARTRSEMIQASTEFKKGGYSDEESAQLAKVASLYQNVADSQLSAGDASAYVISQMKAFDIEVGDAMSIIDKTNEVNYLPSL